MEPTSADTTGTPPLGFEQDETENERIIAAVAKAQPDLLLIGLGAPKQELWVSRHAQHIEAKAALCIGAIIDFLAGEKSRSPPLDAAIGFRVAAPHGFRTLSPGKSLPA